MTRIARIIDAVNENPTLKSRDYSTKLGITIFAIHNTLNRYETTLHKVKEDAFMSLKRDNEILAFENERLKKSIRDRDTLIVRRKNQKEQVA